mmetsp:Transcript_25427/g.55024  ORF Transcript_25427/g.55024 Transcript_25427/m.55024 type:complete len:113 (-) Transcript_25427:2-340(-)
MNTRYMSNDTLETELLSFSTVPHCRVAAPVAAVCIVAPLSMLPRSSGPDEHDVVLRRPSKADATGRTGNVRAQEMNNDRMAAKEFMRSIGAVIDFCCPADAADAERPLAIFF